MGTWSGGIFDSDEAMDWLVEFQAVGGIICLATTLEAESDGDYLEASQGVRALCAAEVIAALRGQAAPDLPKAIHDWTNSHTGLDVSYLLPLALVWLDRICGDDSELNELWRENAEYHLLWRSSVSALKKRLQAQPV